ncbi:hypothetical protein [Deinococcus sp.]|uniref:hypothetical protein n=1 Tax=Deinococcus sp. TaxID=47478 RepID=UPI0025BF805D|nr:hypothetical protein [Deinococcus sp.]
MTLAWPQFRSLVVDDHPRLLTWLGPQFIDPNHSGQRSVLGILMPVASFDGSRNTRLLLTPVQRKGSCKVISVPAGELPALTIGTLFLRGRRAQHQPSARTLSLVTDFTFQRVRRLGELDSGGQPLFPKNVFGCPQNWATFSDSPCLILPGHDGAEVVVPMTEMIRYCYGSSGRLLQAVLSDRLPEVLAELEAHSTWKGDVLHVDALPKGFSAEESLTMAWLLQDAWARKQALQLDTSFMAASAPGAIGLPKLSHVAALFPYQGEAQIHVSGNWVANTGMPRFLVQQVLRVDVERAFEVSLPSHTASDESGQPDEGDAGGKTLLTVDMDNIVVDSTAQGQRSRATIWLPGLPAHFSQQRPLFHDVERQPSPSVSVQGTLTVEGTVSTGRSATRKSRVRKAVVGSVPEGSTFKLNPMDVERLRGALTLLESRGFNVRELALGTSRRPSSVPWRCLIFEISRDSHYAYILEKERLNASDFGPLIVAARTRWYRASEAALLSLLLSRLGQRTWPAAPLGWRFGRITHSYTTNESLARTLRGHLPND